MAQSCFLGGGIFEQALWMRGFKRFLMDLITDELLATALLDTLLELYIPAPSHNIQADVPPENVLAMDEAIQV
jgi:hypothetical protein